MRRSLIAVCFVLVRCGADLEAPTDTLIFCSTRQPRCPQPLVCDSVRGECVAELDMTAPTLSGAEAPSGNRVVLKFDEDIRAPSVEAPTQFVFDPPLGVVAAVRSGVAEVALDTERQVGSQSYVVHVDGVRDLSGNLLDASAASAVFLGYGSPPDADPPSPLSPSDRQTVVGGAAMLVWETRSGATTYTVEVAVDPDFDVLVGPPISTAVAEALVSGLDAVTYYWRVRSDLSEPSAVRSFDVLVDTVHVYCAPGAACVSADDETGSKTHPYRTATRAVAAAASLGLDEIHIASRGAEIYEDALYVTVPLTLRGGYTAAFDEMVRDPIARPTTIASQGTVLYASQPGGPLLLDGLRLAGDNGGQAFVITVIGGGDLTLSQTRIDAAEMSAVFYDPEGEHALTLMGTTIDVVDGRGIAPDPAGGTHLIMQDSTVHVHAVSASREVLGSGLSTFLIERCTLEMDSEVVSSAQIQAPAWVLAASGSGTVRDSSLSSIYVAAGFGDSYAAAPLTVEHCLIVIDGPRQAPASIGNATFVNSIIVTRNSSGTEPSFRLAGTGATFVHDTFIAENGSAVALVNTAGGIFTNNLFVVRNSGSAVTALLAGYSAPSTFAPRSFENNVIFVPSARSAYITSSAVQNTTALNALDDGTARFAANIVSNSSTTGLFDDEAAADYQLAVDLDGVASAGKDTSLVTCGTHQQPVSCGNVVDDRAGAARTLPVSAGAYER